MSDGSYIINDEQYFGEKAILYPGRNSGGKGSYIHPTAVIFPGVEIGDGVYIGAHSVIGGPPEHRDYWDKEYMGVIIGDNVRVSNLVTIDAGTERDTVIGNNCVLLAHSHVGHDAVISKGTTISCGAKIGGHAKIGPDCNIGLNASIHQWKEIPQGCMIGMGGIVTKKSELLPNRKYAGNPVRDIGENIKK